MLFMLSPLALGAALLAAAAPQAVAAAQAAPALWAPRPASPEDAAATQKTVRALVNAIRYSKDEMASKKLNLTAMARVLLGDSWATASAAQQHDIVATLTTLLSRTSFPKGRELFAYLDALLFEAAQQRGDRIFVKTVVVVHRNLKKVELPIEWVLTREQGTWQVVDIISMGESTAEGIRDEEVAPLLQEGGVQKLIDTMHERASKLVPATPAAAP